MSSSLRPWVIDNSQSKKIKENKKSKEIKKNKQNPNQNQNQKENKQSDSRRIQLITKKAWEVATSPKAFFFKLLFLWLLGGSLNIFNIFFIFSAITEPIKNIFKVQSSFERYSESRQLILQKICFVAMSLLAVVIILYRFSQMGLIPTEGDWASYLQPKQMNEFTTGSY
eukprot:TRINITY_DN2585_c0_g2_i1.p1 TRINITY_DN2585_c0_g2~~TRINITY_DN2585_c0_g2_i1.p1  ORF type:complete len:193 (-),score=63.90 TRINITY_DN2585_c0_g2_i1:61-567(-)